MYGGAGMKRLLLLTLVGGVILSAASALADGDFYLIAGGGKPVGKEITSLPYTINASGMYYLSRTLTSAAGGITINSNDVTLDLMGFTLRGPGKAGNSYNGIDVSGPFGNVEIRNGTITYFGGDGVHCLGTNCRIIGLRVSDIGAAGISQIGLNQVISCLVKSCGHEGIWSGEGSMIKGNSVKNNTGSGISAGDKCIAIGNSSQDNGSHGISTGFGSMVQNNQASGNFESGISVGQGSTVMGNIASGNGTSGILAGSSCTVTDNSARLNPGFGISTATYCTISRNTVEANPTFAMNAGDYCTITNNTIRGVLSAPSTCTRGYNTVN
jgi:hypothetical protein